MHAPAPAIPPHRAPALRYGHGLCRRPYLYWALPTAHCSVACRLMPTAAPFARTYEAFRAFRTHRSTS